MPKHTKLHMKGKPSSMQKPVKIKEEICEDSNPEESVRQFQLELCWCIQQLERSLAEKKGNEKQLQEAWKVLTVLKNNNQPIIRKRQLMRTHFGDYRSKMATEEKKLTKMASKMKITENVATPKATFLRKSAFLSTGNESFRFNFKLDSSMVDSGNIQGIDSSIENIKHTTELTPKPQLASVTMSDSNEPFKFTFSDSEFRFNFKSDTT